MWRVILCNTLFLAKFKIMLIFFDFMLSHLVIFINMQKLMYVYTGKRHVLFTFDNCIGTYSTDLTNTWVVFHIWNDMIWYDMIYDVWYDMVWYDICYDMVRYDMMYSWTAIGFTPSGSSTVHIYMPTVHRTTQWNRIHRTEYT